MQEGDGSRISLGDRTIKGNRLQAAFTGLMAMRSRLVAVCKPWSWNEIALEAGSPQTMGESRKGWMTALRGAVGRHLFEVMFLTEDNKRANMSF